MIAEMWNPKKYEKKHEGWDEDNIEVVTYLMALIGTITEKDNKNEISEEAGLEMKTLLNKIDIPSVLEEVVDYIESLNEDEGYVDIQSIRRGVENILVRADKIVELKMDKDTIFRSRMTH